MLCTLDTRLHKIVCIDEIDETVSTTKWTKKAQKQLDKLNKDSNMTAGLEAELTIAINARVMLRRNIDTKYGLVNGAIGTVKAISASVVMVKFDHIDEPCPIEMVKGKFLLMKSFYVFRKQFPLTVSYAVTVHKCQGLSLDCAIVDLSNSVFCAGMAYVAISRVRRLDGLHLTSFDPASIIVSSSGLEEVNRLRSCFRKDLSLYDIPPTKKCPIKRKIPLSDESCPPTKKRPVKFPSLRKGSSSDGKKRTVESTSGTTNEDCVITAVHRPGPRTEWADYRYYPVDESWQRQACDTLNVRFVCPIQCQTGGADVILTRPDLRTRKRIRGDGNCLYRAMSYIITGCEEQHFQIRTAIVSHMRTIPHLLNGLGADGHPNYLDVYNGGYESVEAYLAQTRMAVNGVWGTDFEMSILAHKLNTIVYSYKEDEYWIACFANGIDKSIPKDINCQSMYIYYTGNHFDVVTSVHRRVRS